MRPPVIVTVLTGAATERVTTGRPVKCTRRMLTEYVETHLRRGRQEVQREPPAETGREGATNEPVQGARRAQPHQGDLVKPLLFLSLPHRHHEPPPGGVQPRGHVLARPVFDDALAAISFAFPLVFLLISLGMGLSVAGSVLVAQHTGAEEHREAEYAASQTVTFACWLPRCSARPATASSDFLRFSGASTRFPGRDGLPAGRLLGLPFMFGFFVFISLMRGAGTPSRRCS